MKSGPHQVRTDILSGEAASFPHRNLNLLEGLEDGGVMVAPVKVRPCAVGDNRMENASRQRARLSERLKGGVVVNPFGAAGEEHPVAAITASGRAQAIRR